MLVGTLVGQELVDDGAGDPEGRLAHRIRVERVLKGDAGRAWTAYSPNTSARWTGDIGKRYVFFAASGELESSCSGLDTPAYVARVDAELRQFRRAKTASIEGTTVGLGPRSPRPLLIAESRAGTHAIRIDADGRFSGELPPGRYRLHADNLRPSVYSAPLGHVTLQAGQCALLELESVR
ncbi:hypothetical protein [Lysobacter brunescens]|uniref:Carboxypeptidase regulatory-like domain-containing protein n=1 Tax=Lysobacter brunescens TaxID=262323 RepID=A0ABW2Y9B8_9GAMM